MDLELSPDDISALESRTEGWVAGLQLAGISMQGIEDKASFIQSFTGSHQFVMDFLVEEVLENQSESVKSFLLQTSILKRLCGPLCDAVLDKDTNSGQKTLEYLEQNNLFLIPLDNERRWYRYHHLFADILKQRLAQSSTPTVNYDVLHTRASVWFENNGLEIEAFEHAVAANDLERAERIVEGDGIPLHFRGKGSYVLRWLESLPRTELTTKPSLQVMYASALLFVGRHTAVEQELQIAEASLQAAKENDKSRDLIGRIAAIRATLAVISNDVETIIAHALHAQEHLHANNKLFRSIATWSLGVANQFTGDSQAASEAFEKTIAIGGKTIYTIAATINLGLIQEKDTKLSLATTNFKNAIEMGGDPPQLITCEAYLGLARIYYEFNNFDSAQKNAQQGLHLMEQMEKIDSFASYGILLSKLLLARGDISGAVNILNEAEVYVLNHNFEFRMPDVAAAQVLALLPQGDLTTAANLAKKYELPFSLARVHLAEGDPNAALAVLEPLHQQMDTTVWRNEQLKMMILTAVAHYHQGNKNEAVHTLGNAMALTEREGYIRSFVDEGKVMEALLSEAIAQGVMPGYSSKLLEVIKSKKETLVEPPIQPLINPLSKRELEILALIAAGLKNKEIAEKLFVSINTILYHTKNIYNKLGVNKRTLAILKARELNLLQEE
jgi:LuxR family maltose regulon positive regulatory protein